MNSHQSKNSVLLIGMPGSGKSTLGVQLAKELALDFVDTDLLIQKTTAQPLQTTLDTQGCQALREIEHQVLCAMTPSAYQKTVIATGGSAVYSAEAMRHLSSFSWVVYLHVPETNLLQRIPNMATRGIAKRPEQTFTELYRERHQLYERYADATLSQAQLNQSQCLERLQQLVTSYLAPVAR